MQPPTISREVVMTSVKFRVVNDVATYTTDMNEQDTVTTFHEKFGEDTEVLEVITK